MTRLERFVRPRVRSVDPASTVPGLLPPASVQLPALAGEGYARVSSWRPMTHSATVRR